MQGSGDVDTPSVVERAVQSTELRDRGAYQRDSLRLNCDIRGHEDRLATGGFDFPHCFLADVLAAGADYDGGALGGNPLGDRSSDSCASSCDHNDLRLEATGHGDLHLLIAPLPRYRLVRTGELGRGRVRSSVHLPPR